MASRIAVIGNSDSIEYFRVLGCDTWETHGGELSREQYDAILEKEYRLIFVTEEVYETYRDIIVQRSKRRFPVVSIIPDVHGAVWDDGAPRTRGIAFEEMRNAVIRAVGQDISDQR